MDAKNYTAHDSSHFDALADQHEQRRVAGLPTLSVLVGSVASARRQWRAWAVRCKRSAVIVAEGMEREWYEAWLRQLLRERDVYLDAEQYVYRRLPGMSSWTQGGLHDKTPHELALLFECAHLDDRAVTPDGLCRWLLMRRLSRQPLTVDELVRAHTNVGEPSPGVRGALGQMLSLLDGGSHPAPLVVSDYANTVCQEEDSVGARAKWLEKAIPHLVQLITSVPRWTVGLAIDESSWDRYTSGTPESFAKAVVEQHVIHVPCWSANRVRQVVTASLARAMPELEPVFVQVACAGASDALVARLIDAVRTGPGCELGRNDVMGGEVAARQPETHSMEESDPWKSLQERFLFELLEHTSDLAGRFQLNASPGFLFGTQLAEVDLLCADLKIAVEIDGYYHFTGPDSYRRDRRKDVLLQQHGFLVMRYLAEDIVPRMGEILQSIRTAVQSRESQSTILDGKEAGT
jgi:hypothetical protein